MATVDFTLNAFAEFLAEARRGARGNRLLPYATLLGFYDSMLSASSGRRVGEVMTRANELLDGHGVEGIRVEGAYVDNFSFDIVGSYVNMGDTYDGTIVHDSENNSFHLTTYGDWLQQYESTHQREDSCSSCGQMFEVTVLDENSGTCPDCFRRREEGEDTEREEASAFPVQIRNETRGWLNDATAYWHDTDRGPELTVLIPIGGALQGEVPPRVLLDGYGTIYRVLAEGGFTPLEWSLTRQSIDVALVEMDRFLEL